MRSLLANLFPCKSTRVSTDICDQLVTLDKSDEDMVVEVEVEVVDVEVADVDISDGEISSSNNIAPAVRRPPPLLTLARLAEVVDEDELDEASSCLVCKCFMYSALVSLLVALCSEISFSALTAALRRQ